MEAGVGGCSVTLVGGGGVVGGGVVGGGVVGGGVVGGGTAVAVGVADTTGFWGALLTGLAMRFAVGRRRAGFRTLVRSTLSATSRRCALVRWRCR